MSPKQEEGRRLLRVVESEAAGLQPDMRTFILWKMAEGLRNSDPRRAKQLLHDAFITSVSIEDVVPENEGDRCSSYHGCGIKVWLERSVLQSMTPVADIDALLPQALPEVQKQVTGFLIHRYIANKDLGRAKQLITSLADQGEYPYWAAMELMFALPSGSPTEKVAIFPKR